MRRVNRTLLAQLKAELKISCPLRIEWKELPIVYRGYTMAVHEGAAMWNGEKHFVELAEGRTLERNRLALLHELKHCSQKESVGDPYLADALYEEQLDTYGYDAAPLELEAEAFSVEAYSRYAGLIYDGAA